ncbi:Re/Si-specific NAD(P)(+) transhydrogenase subunit alpha [Candidatus Palauibacter soopunensis]|uniref:Re/Si-specific NAD(P)(+) transhydrogenase subunit alpha n=1 Tax=Candidatus Palauibacter soopunensis TaxID=3056739 RepID=UPI0023921D1B|nr:Re/Si-specific NAD(P)(+) transhydrogenase subunit alpha [Candidatus Palauibacter soopunensis]MDE2879410.1 Re/Si-specific NAD(P)(+) transhydrogenase subunit alpha [Candidatus Palauibacter soopunensis]
MSVRICVPRETAAGESRVALTPDGAKRLRSDDISIAIEAGAGRAAGFPDAAYEDVGVEIVPDAGRLLGEADVVFKVAPPSEAEADGLREGAVLACLLRPHESGALIERLAGRGVTALALELVPRITRAQSMDALSSQSNLAGYKAVLLGANSLGRIFPLLMTAAGTLSPARVLVLGAGVAGLQAIATARRLGADTWGYDIRAAVREEVESLGAKFVDLQEGAGEAAEDAETEGGYAKELEEAEQARQRELLAQHVARADVVITTALVPGRRAPVLITDDVVDRMKEGSVIVDLAGEAGGNCSLSAPGETVVERGVTIHAPLHVPGSLPYHASQLLGRNLSALVKPMIGEDGVSVDLEDDVIGPCCVTHAGEVRFGA